jgi:hypothetical protein
MNVGKGGFMVQRTVNLTVTDVKTLPLANLLDGPSLVETDPKRLLEYCFNENLKSLTYLKNLANPGLPDGLNEDAFPIEILLMKELSLMSDMWDIPLVVVVQGGHRVSPQTSSGVWWAMIEDAITARKSRILRVNGLFGPSVHNDVWNALGSDNPTFDSRWKINPLHESQLVYEIQDSLNLRIPNGFVESMLLGSEKAATWHEMMTLVVPTARGYDPANDMKEERRRPVSWASYERSRIWKVAVQSFDPSWEAISKKSVESALWVDPFAKLAELATARGHKADYPNPPEVTDCA